MTNPTPHRSEPDPQTAVILRDVAISLRELVERAIVTEQHSGHATAALKEILTRLETMDKAIAPIVAEHRDREAVVRARAHLHEQESVRREALGAWFAQVSAPFRSPVGVAVIVAILGALASRFGVELPTVPPASVINEATGSSLTIRRYAGGG